MFAELMMMISGAIGGVRTFIWSQLLLAVPLYVVALVFRQTLGEMSDEGNGAEAFSSVAESFFTTFRCLVVGDCTDSLGRPIFVRISDYYGPGYALFYSFASVFMMFGLSNVIIAIYVENTVAAAKFNELRQKQNRLTDMQVFRERAFELCDFIWNKHPDNAIAKVPLEELTLVESTAIKLTPDFFAKLRQERHFAEILRDLDIADEEQIDLFDTLDVDGSGFLDFEELIQGIAKLRGDARRSDIISVSLMMRAMLADFNAFESRMNRRMQKQQDMLKGYLPDAASATESRGGSRRML